MKRHISFSFAVCVSLLVCAQSSAQRHEGTNALTVHVQVDEELSSATAIVGQEVHMHVSASVTKDGKELVAQGAPVRARLTRVKRPGHGDRDGQIKLTIVSAQSIGGDWIPLHKGAIRKGHRLIALFAGPCSVPFPLTMAMVGEDVKIPNGQALTAYIRSDDLQ